MWRHQCEKEQTGRRKISEATATAARARGEAKGKEESWGVGGDGLGGGARGEPNPATSQMPPNAELKPE